MNKECHKFEKFSDVSALHLLKETMLKTRQEIVHQTSFCSKTSVGVAKCRLAVFSGVVSTLRHAMLVNYVSLNSSFH